MPTKTDVRKMPKGLYAAAGAGDLAYEQLRKLPEKVAELRGRVVELGPVVTDAVSERKIRADLDRLRDTARRNAAAVVTGAQAAQEKAAAVYEGLVARGARVVASARTTAAKEQLATAKAEVMSAVGAEAKGEVKAAKAETKATDARSEVSAAAARRPKTTTTRS